MIVQKIIFQTATCGICIKCGSNTTLDNAVAQSSDSALYIITQAYLKIWSFSVPFLFKIKTLPYFQILE